MCTANHLRKLARGQLGFSFLEIMLVVVIIGIMVAVVGPRLAGQSKKAKITSTENQMANIKTALGIFEINVGDYPTTQQGLEALVTRPSDVSEDEWVQAMDEVPRDPWGNDFIYRYPGEHGADYDLISKGPDEQEGTDDDITNFKTREPAG